MPQLRAQPGIGLHEAGDDTLTGHPGGAVGEGNELGDRAPVDGDLELLACLDPAEDLGCVVAQIANGDLLHRFSVAYGLHGLETAGTRSRIAADVRCAQAALAVDLDLARHANTNVESAEPAATRGQLLRQLIHPDRYPEAWAAVNAGAFDDQAGIEREFSYGLDRILDGLGTLLDRSPTHRRKNA